MKKLTLVLMRSISVAITLLALSIFIVPGYALETVQQHKADKTVSPANKEKDSARKKTSNFKVGVLYWSMNIPGQVAMRKGLEKQIDHINRQNGISNKPTLELVVKIAGDGDQGIERQIIQMRELIKAEVDIIIAQPTDIAALSEPLKEANKAGIPVVAYDQYILGGKLAAYVTSDNYQAGYLGGEYVAAHFPNDKKLRIILVEYPHVSSTVERVDGYFDALNEYEQKYEVLKNYSAVEPVSGKKAAKQILKDFPGKNSFDVIFTVNDGGGMEIAKALIQAERNEVFFTTVDGDPYSVELIKNNTIVRLDSAQFCGELGAESARIANRILNKEHVPKLSLVPVFPITRETVNLYNGWLAPMPVKFKKSWKSKKPYWEPFIRNPMGQ